MKKILLLSVLFLISFIVSFAQAPQGFKYQAIAREPGGDILSNQQISLEIKLLAGSDRGEAVYTETHSVLTNEHGLINIEIGAGDVKQGLFSQVDWGISSYYVAVGIDVNGGTDFRSLGTTKLLSVPYALYAERSGSESGRAAGVQWGNYQNHIFTGTGGAFPSGNAGIGTWKPNAKLHVLNVDGYTSEFSRVSNDPGNALILFRKSRGIYTDLDKIEDTDNLGMFRFEGYDSLNYNPAAWFRSSIDGPVVPGSVPGNLRFATTAVGAAAPVEHVRITNDGNVGIGTTSPDMKLNVNGNFHVENGISVFEKQVFMNDPANAINKDQGALVVTNGGLGVEQDISAGGTITSGNSVTVDGTVFPGTITDSQGKLSFISDTLITNGWVGLGSSDPLGQLDVNGWSYLDQTTINTDDGRFYVMGGNEILLDVGDKITFEADDYFSIHTTDILKLDGDVGILIGKPGSPLTIGGDLIVQGDGYFEHALDVEGHTTLDQTTINTSDGRLYVNGSNEIYFNPAARIYMAATGNSQFTTSGTMTLGGATTNINGTTNFSGVTNINNTLNVSGITSITNTTQSNSTTSGALKVAGGAGIAKNLHVGGSISAASGTAGIGVAAPSNMILHVKGSGSYGGNHIALFENTGGSSPDGIAIKVSSTSVSKSNNYLTFYDGNNSIKGAVEGITTGELASDPEYIFGTVISAFNIAFATADVVGAASSANVCAGFGVVACPPVPSLIVAASVKLGLAIAQEAARQAFYYDNVGISYSSGSGDYAEYLERLNPDEMMEMGDIMGVFGGKITKNTKDAQQIMVVSMAPIVLGNKPPTEEEHLYEKVAFMGQVPVKVLGAVNEGDFIIPSGLDDGTGVAVSPEMMTAEEFTKVVGRAWGSSEIPSLKLINVAVGLDQGDVADFVNKQMNILTQTRSELDVLKAEVTNLKELEEKFEKLQRTIEQLEAFQIQANNNY